MTREVLDIDPDVRVNLQNFVDRAILQTMIDSKNECGGPLRILEAVPFQGDKLEKDVDGLALDESVIMPIIYRKKPIPY